MTPSPAICDVSSQPRQIGSKVYMVLSLVLADLLALLLAVALGLSFKLAIERQLDIAAYLRLWPFLLVFLGVYAIVGLYSGMGLSAPEELKRATIASTLVFLISAAATVSLRGAERQFTGSLILAIALAIVFVPLLRAIVRRYVGSQQWWGYPAIIFGAGQAGRAMVEAIQKEPGIGLRPVAFIDDDFDAPSAISGVPVVRGFHSVSTVLAMNAQRPAYAVVATTEDRRHTALALVERFASHFSHVLIIPDLHGYCSLFVNPKTVGGLLGLELSQSSFSVEKRVAKRMLDLLLTIGGGLMILPFLFAIAIAIKIDSRGPIVYGQRRIGRNGNEFTAWKFRSMVVDAEQVLQRELLKDPVKRREWDLYHKLKNDARVTRVGRFLRKTSLDELPQLWNVLRGEMSLVGPRPIVHAEVERYGEKFQFYTRVPGGVTGLWQVSGRNDTSYEERVSLDTFYVRNWSVWLDFCILFRTVGAVLFRRGAY